MLWQMRLDPLQQRRSGEEVEQIDSTITANLPTDALSMSPVTKTAIPMFQS
jgi:hypothetical protein